MKFLLCLVALVALSREDPPVCGKTPIPPSLSFYEDKILGGNEAVPGSWPWNVAILNIYGGLICGGALIDDSHVLTAAHCVLGEEISLIEVHLGSHNVTGKDIDQQNVGVTQICSHRNYRGNANDIAVLTLKEKVVFGDTIQPVCLPPNKQELPDRSVLYFTGWGRIENGSSPQLLRQALTLSIESERCYNIRPISLPEKVLCTSRDDGSSCHGDNGGPLVGKDGDAWYLQGVVSAGPLVCGAENWPMYFTKVSHFLDDWLNPVLGGNTALCRLS